MLLLALLDTEIACAVEGHPHILILILSVDPLVRADEGPFPKNNNFLNIDAVALLSTHDAPGVLKMHHACPGPS